MALARGISHAELLATTSAAEIGEYRALDLIDPLFDGQRLEAAIGSLTNVTFNMLRDGDSPATTVDKWLPDYTARFRPKEENEDEIKRAMDAWLGPEGK